MFAALIRRNLAGRRAERDELAFQSMTFSLSTEVPRPTERRSDERLAAILPLARLVTGDGQDLCRVRNISAGGLMAEMAGGGTPDSGTRVFIELDSSHRIPGSVVWVRPPMVGIRFDETVDVRELIAKRPRGGFAPRPPRLEVTCGATVRLDGLYHKVEVRDISQGGMRVALNEWRCVGKPVVVTVDSLRPIRGIVRWYREAHAGIVFDKPLTFDELAEWLGKRVDVASLKTGAWNGPRR